MEFFIFSLTSQNGFQSSISNLKCNGYINSKNSNSVLQNQFANDNETMNFKK